MRDAYHQLSLTDLVWVPGIIFCIAFQLHWCACAWLCGNIFGWFTCICWCHSSYKRTIGYWWLRPLYSVGRDWVPKVLWRLLARLSQNVVKVARLFQSVVYLRECVARAILWKTGVRCQHSSCFTVVLTTMKEKRTIIYPSTPTFLTMCTGSPNKVWPGVGRLQSCSAFCKHRL